MDTPSPTTPSPTTPIPLPRKGAEPNTPTEEQPASIMVVPVPLPRQNVPPKVPEELGDKLAEVTLESEKSESEDSTKTSSSDSGIEDGKSTPTSEEEKVLFVLDLEIKYVCVYLRCSQ